MICPVHEYSLGQCPMCDGDPSDMIRYYMEHPEARTPRVEAVLTYQIRRQQREARVKP